MAAKKKTSKNVSAATLTQMQELGSAWVFKRAIQDNVIFNSPNDIVNDKNTYKELLKIWKTVGKVDWDDEVDGEWVVNFYKQQKTLLQKIGKPTFTEFCRSSDYVLPGSKRGETFMEWVSDLVKKEFQISQKDNWNPADIWLIQNEAKWRREITKAYDNRDVRKKRTIEAELAKFNAIFRGLFRSRQIVGISLKKISGKTAQWKEVNVTEKFFKKLEATHMTLDSAKCLLGTKRINPDTAKKDIERGKFRGLPDAATLTQDTVLQITDPGLAGEPGAKYKVQIKANDSTKFSNLKWEPTITSATGARLGKATVELVLDLMKSYNILRYYEPDNKKYPRNKTEFGEVEDDYRDIIGELVSDRFIDVGSIGSGQVAVETAIINLKETFDQNRSQPWVAVSKLQQLRFLYALMTLSKRDRNDFCTSLIFTAEKAGRRYGPYGKLY
tara:strand:- start:31 stop:1356 length:1326 start_codon:yes stop_codon:yes gene_type:complete